MLIPSETKTRTLIYILLGTGILWRVIHYLLDFPQGGDETFVTLSILTRDFAGMMQKLEYEQIVPVGFMWLERLLVGGGSGLTLRLLPMLALVAALIIFWRFALEVMPPAEALPTVGFFAAASVLAQAEVKPYAFDLLLAAGLDGCAWMVLRGSGKTVWRWLLLILGPLSLWLSYPVVFVVFGIGLILFIDGWLVRNPRSIYFAITYSAVALISFSIMYFGFARVQTGSGSWLWTIPPWKDALPPLGDPAQLPGWILSTHLGLMFSYLRFDNPILSGLTALLVWTGCLSLVKQKRIALLSLLLIPLPLAFLAAALGRYPYGGSVRTMLYLAPAGCLLAGFGMAALVKFLVAPARAVQGAYALALLFFGLTIQGIVGDLLEPYYLPGLKKVQVIFGDLGRQARVDDRWVVYDLPGPAPQASHEDVGPGFDPCFRYNILASLERKNTYWNPRSFQIEAPPGGRVFLLVNREYRRRDVDENRLGLFLTELSHRYGFPRRRVFSIENTWDIEVYCFDRKTSEEPFLPSAKRDLQAGPVIHPWTVRRDHQAPPSDGWPGARWRHSRESEPSPFALPGGYELEGKPTFICRGRYQEALHAGEMKDGRCLIGWGGEAVSLSDFEWLERSGTGGYRWIRSDRSNGMAQQGTGGESGLCCGYYHDGMFPGRLENGLCSIGRKGEKIPLSLFYRLEGEGMAWEKWTGGPVPGCAVPGGKTLEGDLFFCRGQAGGKTFTGIFSGSGCRSFESGQEARSETIELLVSPGGCLHWSRNTALAPHVSSSSAETPGRVCRSFFQGGLHTGKVHKGRCNFPWNVVEIVSDNYEILNLE
jgi:hypothetical protein